MMREIIDAVSQSGNPTGDPRDSHDPEYNKYNYSHEFLPSDSDQLLLSNTVGYATGPRCFSCAISSRSGLRTELLGDANQNSLRTANVAEAVDSLVIDDFIDDRCA